MAIRIARSFNWERAAWQGYPAAHCNYQGTWRMPLNATRLACSIVATWKTIEVGYFLLRGSRWVPFQVNGRDRRIGELTRSTPLVRRDEECATLNPRGAAAL